MFPLFFFGCRCCGHTTHRWDDADPPVSQWTSDHGGTVNAIAYGPSNTVYEAGTNGIKKYDSAGVLLWSASHGSDVNCIAVDGSGNVFSGGETQPDGGLKKFDSDGVLVWESSGATPEFTTVRGVSVEGDGTIWVAGYDTDEADVLARHLDSDGVLILSFKPEIVTGGLWVSVQDIAVLSTGDVAICGEMIFATDRLSYIAQYQDDGTALWSRSIGGPPRWLAIAIDPSDDVVACGEHIVSGDTVIKYNGTAPFDAFPTPIFSNGNAEGWPAFTDVEINDAGEIYLSSQDAISLWKLDNDGDLIWNSSEHTAALNAVDINSSEYPIAGGSLASD